MAQLAIKGHAIRGNEVVELLEMLGGKNDHIYGCNVTDYVYSINEHGIIDWYIPPHTDSPLAIFTLEKFLEKFPSKVGDKVKVCGDNLGVIISMRWESDYVVYKVKLTKNGYETSKTSENLQPYEEIPTYLNRKVNEQAEEIKKILEPVKEIIEEIKLDIPNGYEFFGIDDDNKIVLTKKQSQYPKTYIECAKILDCFSAFHIDGYKNELIEKLQALLICRDAYWKMAGEQMELGKPWKPDFTDTKEMYYIFYKGYIEKGNQRHPDNHILIFPTVEMRDAFYENFKELIEHCKELL